MITADNGHDLPDRSAVPGNEGEIAAPVDFSERARLPFPVVGIGASAGGLEALEGFFRAVPEASGMAFIVVQHLPPERESMMAEILARHTSMPVHLIEEGMAVEPNNVYVIRPGFTVTLGDGALHLGEPVEKRGHRRPVDDFFRSLAAEQKERAIGVVLSAWGPTAPPARRRSRRRAGCAWRKHRAARSSKACRRA